jgi:hypothetical protein
VICEDAILKLNNKKMDHTSMLEPCQSAALWLPGLSEAHAQQRTADCRLLTFALQTGGATSKLIMQSDAKAVAYAPGLQAVFNGNMIINGNACRSPAC